MAQLETLILMFAVCLTIVGSIIVLVVIHTYSTLNPLRWKVRLALSEWNAARLRTSQVRGYAAHGLSASTAHESSIMQSVTKRGRGGGRFLLATVEAYPTAKAIDVASDSIRKNTDSADLELSLLRAYLQAVQVYNAARTKLLERFSVWIIGNNIFPRWDVRVPHANTGFRRKSDDLNRSHGKQRRRKSFPCRRRKERRHR